ncbi:MAG: chemotaxis protein CheX [Vulcanimicrobiaceae bacterium]
MSEDDLKIFISGASNYFTQVGRSAAEISTPFVREDGERVTYDFSAVIGVSGSQRGCVYFSAPREMVSRLVTLFGEPEHSDDIYADFVGEIANTIAGNAREQLGSSFMISVPVVFRGQAEAVRFPQDAPTFVIPVLWEGYRSALVISLKDDPTFNRNGVTLRVAV